ATNSAMAFLTSLTVSGRTVYFAIVYFIGLNLPVFRRRPTRLLQHTYLRIQKHASRFLGIGASSLGNRFRNASRRANSNGNSNSHPERVWKLGQPTQPYPTKGLGSFSQPSSRNGWPRNWGFETRAARRIVAVAAC